MIRPSTRLEISRKSQKPKEHSRGLLTIRLHSKQTSEKRQLQVSTGNKVTHWYYYHKSSQFRKTHLKYNQDLLYLKYSTQTQIENTQTAQKICIYSLGCSGSGLGLRGKDRGDPQRTGPTKIPGFTQVVAGSDKLNSGHVETITVNLCGSGSEEVWEVCQRWSVVKGLASILQVPDPRWRSGSDSLAVKMGSSELKLKGSTQY